MDKIKTVSVAGWHQGVGEEQEKTRRQFAASVCGAQAERGLPGNGFVPLAALPQAPKRDFFSPAFCVARATQQPEESVGFIARTKNIPTLGT